MNGMFEMERAMAKYSHGPYGTLLQHQDDLAEKMAATRGNGSNYPPKPVTPDDDPKEKFLRGLNLSAVKDHVVKAGHCTADKIDELEREYKRWLFLAFKYPEQELIVPPMLDEMWHEHILFTMEYHEMCRIGGHFIHHVPNTSENFVGMTDGARTSTENLYRKHYGKNLGEMWASNGPCRGEGGCMRCEKPKK